MSEKTAKRNRIIRITELERELAASQVDNQRLTQEVKLEYMRGWNIAADVTNIHAQPLSVWNASLEALSALIRGMCLVAYQTGYLENLRPKLDELAQELDEHLSQVDRRQRAMIAAIKQAIGVEADAVYDYSYFHSLRHAVLNYVNALDDGSELHEVVTHHGNIKQLSTSLMLKKRLKPQANESLVTYNRVKRLIDSGLRTNEALRQYASELPGGVSANFGSVSRAYYRVKNRIEHGHVDQHTREKLNLLTSSDR